MKREYDNLDELTKDLKELEKSGSTLNGKRVPITDLLNPEFMRGHTRFDTFEEMLESAKKEYVEKIARDLMNR